MDRIIRRSTCALIVLSAQLSAAAFAQPDSVSQAEARLAAVKAENEQREREAQAAVERERGIAAAQAQLASAEAQRREAQAKLVALEAAGPAVETRATTPTSSQLAAAIDARRIVDAEVREQKKDEAAENFGEFSLGAGLSVTFDVGRNDRIKSASLVNGIVRVDDKENVVPRVMFESHYFFKPQKSLFGVEKNMWGVGPFVAIQPGDNDIINAIAFGAMIGFRRDKEKTDSFNIALGVVVDPNTRLLGYGLKNGEPLPAGETEIRYRETSQIGWMFMTSFSF